MVEISFNYPPELARNLTVNRALKDAANFIRDLWVAKSPYATGAYADGLYQSGSVKVGNGKVRIINYAKHAATVEYGFQGYNLGMAMLNSGRNVKTSKEGHRYKVISIKEQPTARHRKSSVAQGVQSSFAKLMPLGMKPNQHTKYGGLKRYNARRGLRKPIKGGRPNPHGPRGVFTISEKAIRQDPSKWMVPDREGKFLAQEVQKETRAVIRQVLRKAVKLESQRQKRVKGVTPKWHNPQVARHPITGISVSRGR